MREFLQIEWAELNELSVLAVLRCVLQFSTPLELRERGSRIRPGSSPSCCSGRLTGVLYLRSLRDICRTSEDAGSFGECRPLYWVSDTKNVSTTELFTMPVCMPFVCVCVCFQYGEEEKVSTKRQQRV